MGYVLSDDIYRVDGSNGTILVNLKTSAIMDLNIREASLLSEILDNAILDSEDSKRLKIHLKSNNFIKEHTHFFNKEEVKIIDFDFVKSDIAEFRLNQLTIELTNKCSFNCVHCNPKDNVAKSSCFCSRHTSNDLDFDYDDLILSAVKMGATHFVLQGGDVFYNDYTKEKMYVIIESIKKYNSKANIAISTNLYNLDDNTLKKLKEYPGIIFNLQLLATNESDYYNITKVGDAFSKVMFNINLLKKYQFPFVASLLLSRLVNIDEIGKFSQIIGIPITPLFLFNDINQIEENIYDDSIRRVSLIYENYPYIKKTSICMFGQIFMSSDLKVYPCMSFRDFELGDLIVKSLQDIISEKSYKKFWYLCKSETEGCNRCKKNMLCFDCRAIEYHATHNLLGNKYCQVLKEL